MDEQTLNDKYAGRMMIFAVGETESLIQNRRTAHWNWRLPVFYRVSQAPSPRLGSTPLSAQ